jgi:alpha-1,3-rhamnosyl/mannosyltransferase
MAAGLPVLTADRGAMAEVAGDAALLVDPADDDALAAGMARLAWDEALRGRLVSGGLQRVAGWTWERTAATTCAVYAAVLGGGGGVGGGK